MNTLKQQYNTPAHIYMHTYICTHRREQNRAPSANICAIVCHGVVCAVLCCSSEEERHETNERQEKTRQDKKGGAGNIGADLRDTTGALGHWGTGALGEREDTRSTGALLQSETASQLIDSQKDSPTGLP